MELTLTNQINGEDTILTVDGRKSAERYMYDVLSSVHENEQERELIVTASCPKNYIHNINILASGKFWLLNGTFFRTKLRRKRGEMKNDDKSRLIIIVLKNINAMCLIERFRKRHAKPGK